MGEKVKNRFYTTALAFVSDLSTVFNVGINNEPSISSDVNLTDKSSPSKKSTMDIKERKRLAKRIIKSVQSPLENAVRAEAELTGQPIESALKELERLLENSFQIQQDLVSTTGDTQFGDHASIEVDTAGTNHTNSNGNAFVNGGSSELHQNQDNENEDHINVDVEMEDIDAPHDLDDDAIMVATDPSDLIGDTITTAALSEVNGNISPMKSNHTNGVKNEATPPATNGANSSVSNDELGPPTPPVSNGDLTHEQNLKVLIDGGIPQYLLKDFNIDGTEVSEIAGSFTSAASHASDALSDMNDDDMNALQATTIEAEKGTAAAGGRATPAKTKKGKRKRRFGAKAR